MGSIAYDFLTSSILFHPKSLETHFKNESEERIKIELENYRNFCLKNEAVLMKEITERKSHLKTFKSEENVSISFLKQTALYIDQFIVQDPLFKETKAINESSNITSNYIGYQETKFDKEKISHASKYLKDVTPMIAADYLKIFPISYYFEIDDVPFYEPKDQFNDILPRPILEFIKQNMEVCSMEKSDRGWKLLKGPLKPCRGISISFRDMDVLSGYVFHLLEQEVIDFNEETRKVTFRNTLPKYPPNDDQFLAWVNQSMNSSAGNFFKKLYDENIIATKLQSTYLCKDSFSAELISKFMYSQDNIQTTTANNLLNLELSFLENINLERLMQIRENESDIFTSFRLELERNFRELRELTDPKLISLKSENIAHELGEIQVNLINKKFESLKKHFVLDATLAVAGLSMSMLTGGVSLIGTAIAAAKGYKDYISFRDEVKENPAYLLWKVLKK
jgi:hypothetical protein